MNNQNKKYIVTGGAGFIGSHLVDTLIDSGCEVTIIDNLSSGKRQNANPRAKFVRMDLRLPLFMWRRHLKGADGVFHLAAMPRVQLSIDNPLKTHKNNATVTLRVLENCRRAGVNRFIYASSSSIYGGATSPHGSLEGMMPNPLNPYAAQKLMGEYYCQIYTNLFKMNCVSMRFFNVYGERQDPSSEYSGVVSKFKLEQQKTSPYAIIYGDGRQKRDFTYVKEVADVLKRAMICAENDGVSGESFNIGSGKTTSINQLVEKFGFKEKNVFYLEARKGEIRNSFANISKAKKVLGWIPAYRLEDYCRNKDD